MFKIILGKRQRQISLGISTEAKKRGWERFLPQGIHNTDVGAPNTRVS